MTVSTAAPALDVPEDRWRQAGPDHDPAARLATVVTIANVMCHLDAWAVSTKGGLQTAVVDSDAFEQLHEALAADGPFETATIHGRSYVLIASPFS